MAITGPALSQKSTFDLQGHRGARGLKPENTLAAFAEALRIGVTTLELDLALTDDDVLVLSHDPELQPHLTRTDDGAWLDGAEPPVIRELDLEEVQAFDVGRINPESRYARRFPHQEPVDGARIPTFEQVLALTVRAGNSEVRFNIETKLSPDKPDVAPDPETFATAVVELVRRHKIASRTMVQSFDWRTLRQVRQLAPEIATACLTVQEDWLDNIQVGREGPSPWTAGLDIDDHDGSVPDLVRAASCAVWSPYWRGLDADAMASARDLGLQVVVWTVNEPEDMRRLIDLGVDGIITDYPNRLRAVMAERGMPLPAPTPVEP